MIAMIISNKSVNNYDNKDLISHNFPKMTGKEEFVMMDSGIAFSKVTVIFFLIFLLV
jgi:hypothetical protein